MLWVDDDFVTVLDLISIDPESIEIAATENIILDGDNGVIRRAKEECSGTLARYLNLGSLSSGDLILRDVNLFISGLGLQYSYAALTQLVVSGESLSHWSPLKGWVVAKALMGLYRAAINRPQGKDRYEARFNQTEALLEEIYWPNFKLKGVPICLNPLWAPGAIMERAGSFTDGNVILVTGAGGTQDQVGYEVCVTWVAEKYISPTDKHNGESFHSRPVGITVTTGRVIQVTIVGLTAPNGTQPDWNKAMSRYTPGKADRWNMYVGVPGGPYYRQNATPIPLVTTTYTLAGNPVLSGEQSDQGQFEDLFLEIKKRLVRA